jgi:hypothetical protein
VLFDEEGNLRFKPWNIFNIDETNSQTRGKAKTVDFKGGGQSPKKEPTKIVNTTFTFCISAAGQASTTQMIHKGVIVPEEYKYLHKKIFRWSPRKVVGRPKRALQVLCQGIFFLYDFFFSLPFPFFFLLFFFLFFVTHLIEHMRNKIFGEIEQERRDKDEISLMFIDGHGSRINPDLWLEALARKIFTIFLKAHSSTVTQQLDVRFNAVWKELLAEFLTMPDDPTAHNCREGRV